MRPATYDKYGVRLWLDESNYVVSVGAQIFDVSLLICIAGFSMSIFN